MCPSQKHLRVYVQTSPCMPAPRAHVFQHVRVVPVHTEAFLNPHTEGRRQFCLPRKAHVEFSLVVREVHQRNRWILHIFSLKTDREQHVHDSSNHSIFLIKLFSFRHLEGNFGGNQQPDGSIILSRSPPSLHPPPRPHQQHTTHRDRDTETQRHRDTETETETEPKYNERFARQTLSMMFG